MAGKKNGKKITKAKTEVEYEDIFENRDKGKDTENAENKIKINRTDRNTKVTEIVENEDIFENNDKCKDIENDEN